jgi:hypothetical protein
MLDLVFGTRSHCLGDQGIHVRCTLGGAIKNEMECGNCVNLQTLEQAISQKTSRSI